MCRGQHMAPCYDGAAAVRSRLSWRHQPHLCIWSILTQILQDNNLLPTCQGYSLASVSTPPTILVTLLAWPQLHVAVVVVAVVVVMGPVVVVVIGDGVDVDGVVVTGAEQF